MASPRKIGVLTFHKCINYGSYWQSRCLVEGLRARGHDVQLLDHDCGRVNYAEWRCALQPQLPQPTPRSDFPRLKAKARKFFDAFKRLPMSPRFPLHRPDASPSYDAILVGSDEVWNFRHPWYSAAPIFFGDGLKADRLASYAASFGNHQASDGLDAPWAEKLRRFAALSVRDDNSRNLLRGMGSEADIVLDPCLQFPEMPRAHAGDGGGYALVYGFGFPQWLSDAARRWSEGRGSRLLSIGYRNAWADENRLDAGPQEFAELAGGADAVITNFFHGCVFALLNRKPFVAHADGYRSTKINDLAAMLGAGHRLVGEATADDEFADLLAAPPEPHIVAAVAARRAHSQVFLDAALS